MTAASPLRPIMATSSGSGSFRLCSSSKVSRPERSDRRTASRRRDGADGWFHRAARSRVWFFRGRRPSDNAHWRRTEAAGWFASLDRSEASEGASVGRVSSSLKASRTTASVSDCSAWRKSSVVTRPRPSSAARASKPPVARNGAAAVGSRRAVRRRRAVVRCQPLGWRVSAASAVVSMAPRFVWRRGVACSGRIRYRRPRSWPLFRSSRLFSGAGSDCGCSMTSRYMSMTYSAPSGPLAQATGRNHESVEARNSVVSSPGGRSACGPSAVSVRCLRCTRLLPTSPTRTWPERVGIRSPV